MPTPAITVPTPFWNLAAAEALQQTQTRAQRRAWARENRILRSPRKAPRRRLNLGLPSTYVPAKTKTVTPAFLRHEGAV
jgi:hypothetical protein